MRQVLLLSLICATVVGLSSSIAQTSTPAEQFLKLVKEVEIQQAQITANQGKIETKLTEIGENVRVARIFGARSN